MTKALSTKDLQLISDEPRIQDMRIGERLGMAQSRDIRKLIERNKGELETYGTLARHGGAQLRENGATIAVDEYYLNEQQTLLICMFSRTEKAAEVRREVISVYLAYRTGAPSRAEIAGEIRMTELRPARGNPSEVISVFRNQVEILQTLEYTERSLLIARGDLYEMTLEKQRNEARNDLALALLRRTELSNDEIGKEAGLPPSFVEHLRQTLN